MMNQTAGLYAFREIKEEAELLAAFRMRYTIYMQQPHLRLLMVENAAEVDIDGYDIYSRHYGLYKLNGEAEEMIGYLRVIEQCKFPLVEAMLQKLKGQYSFVPPQRKHLFYFQHLFPDAESILNMPLNKNAHLICEPSRFIILPQHRSADLAQFIIESILVIACSLHITPIGLLFCKRDQKIMYLRKGGFEWKAEEKNPEDASNPWNLLMITRIGIEKKMPNLSQRIQQYEADGCFYHELGSVDWQALRYLPVVARRWARQAGII